MRELAGRDSKYRKYDTEGTARSARTREYTSEILCDGRRQNGQTANRLRFETERERATPTNNARLRALEDYFASTTRLRLTSSQQPAYLYTFLSHPRVSRILATLSRQHALSPQFVIVIIVVIAKAHTYIYIVHFVPFKSDVRTKTGEQMRTPKTATATATAKKPPTTNSSPDPKRLPKRPQKRQSQTPSPATHRSPARRTATTA